MKTLPLVTALAASALCSLASAQSSVQVYGRLYPFLEQESGTGASAVGTPVSSLSSAATGTNGVLKIKGMSSGNSNLGFRGKEDLGGGMRAEFQLEGTVALDSGAPGFSFNRNTFVGLETPWGEVRLGLMDTVQKEYGDTIGALGVGSGTPMSSSNILRKVGFGTSSASRFHERRANSVRCDSPEFAGFQTAVQVATQENPTNVAPAKTYSFGLKYDSGPWYFAIAHEIHDNWFGGSTNVPSAQRNNGAADFVTSKDKATQATVEWRPIKGQKFEADIIQKTYKENAIVNGRFQSYKNTAYMLVWEGRWNDQWRTMAQYVKSSAGSCARLNAVCSTDGLEGQKLMVGAAYNISRRTYVFGFWDKMKNGKSARFAANDFGTSPNPGEDITHIIAGISHGF